MTLTVDDAAFRVALEDVLTRIGQAARVGVRGYGESIKTRAMRHINMRSGELDASLTVEDHLDDPTPYLEVVTEEKTDEPHAFEEEFGTYKEAPRPFMRPAAIEAVDDYKIEI